MENQEIESLFKKLSEGLDAQELQKCNELYNFMQHMLRPFVGRDPSDAAIVNLELSEAAKVVMGVNVRSIEIETQLENENR